MSTNAKHDMVIRLVEDTLSGEDGRDFAESLLRTIELRFEEGRARIHEQMAEIEPMFATQRTIGGVQAMVEIVKRAERIAQRYAEAGEIDLSEAFSRFALRVAKVAEERAVPVMAEATKIRASRARGAN